MKIETKLADYLTNRIQDKYNLVISRPVAIDIVRKLLWEIDKNETDYKFDFYNTFMFQSLQDYGNSTKIEQQKLKNHSCYFMAKFIDKKWFLIPIKKGTWLGQLYYRITKTCHKIRLKIKKYESLKAKR